MLRNRLIPAVAATLWSALLPLANAEGVEKVPAQIASDFAQDFLASASMSLAENPFFGSHLAQSFDTHVRVVSSNPHAGPYLFTAAFGNVVSGNYLTDLRREIGQKRLNPASAGAILLANKIIRPQQFRRILSGLETMKPGLGSAIEDQLDRAKGKGFLQHFLHLESGSEELQGKPLTYTRLGRIDSFFDGNNEVDHGDEFVPSTRSNSVLP